LTYLLDVNVLIALIDPAYVAAVKDGKSALCLSGNK